MEGKFVSYLRVSTVRQGQSGLGLDAQRQAVETFLNGGSWVLLKEFVEIESGTKSDRPELARALHYCKVTGAKLLIARLDRLSRNASFLLSLQDAGVDFQAVDVPSVDRLTVGVLALVAERERQLISERTRAALQAAKARGVRLGNPHGAKFLHAAGQGNRAAVEEIKYRADTHAKDLDPIIQELKKEGHRSLTAIARQLNERSICSPRGGRWYAQSVKNLMGRLK